MHLGFAAARRVGIADAVGEGGRPGLVAKLATIKRSLSRDRLRAVLKTYLMRLPPCCM